MCHCHVLHAIISGWIKWEHFLEYCAWAQQIPILRYFSWVFPFFLHCSPLHYKTSEGNIGVLTRVSWSFLAHSPKQKSCSCSQSNQRVISLLTLSDGFWLEPFPGSSVWKSNPSQSIMIRKMILCNNCNLNKWPLANMYVHVQILPGNTHAFLYTLKPIKSHSSTHIMPKHTIATCTTWGSKVICFSSTSPHTTTKYHLQIWPSDFFLKKEFSQQPSLPSSTEA